MLAILFVVVVLACCAAAIADGKNTLVNRFGRSVLHRSIHVAMIGCQPVKRTSAFVSVACPNTCTINGPSRKYHAAFVPSSTRQSTFTIRKKTSNRCSRRYRSLIANGPRHTSLFLNAKDEYEYDQNNKPADDTPKLKIDGKQMMQILAQQQAEEQRRKEIEEFERRFQGTPFRNGDQQVVQQQSINLEDTDTSNFSSRITYTDANTLEIEIPSTGFNSNSVATGAFSALWFSAVAPATFSMLSAGPAAALFMVPFWLAGGVVAKTAVYDPFVSSSLSIGEYLWTVEKKYLKRASTKSEEGKTESLNGASVDVGLVVNGLPQFQIRLFVDGNQSIAFGNGLPRGELDYIARLINDHCETIQKS